MSSSKTIKLSVNRHLTGKMSNRSLLAVINTSDAFSWECAYARCALLAVCARRACAGYRAFRESGKMAKRRVVIYLGEAKLEIKRKPR